MPNWTNNTLTLTGTEEDIAKVKAQLNITYDMPHLNWNNNSIEIITNENPILSFWNIVSPDDLESYPMQSSGGEHSRAKPWTGFIPGNDWYNWNCRNWGCKWDAGDVVLNTDEPNELVYTFDTPWGAPTEAIEKLAEQYPNLLVEMFSEYETGETEYLKWNEQEELV